MQKDYSVVWNDCLSQIKDQIPEQSYNTWFTPIVPVRLVDNVLTIQVPSQFFYEWLEEHYVNVLKNAIMNVLGNFGKLEYSVIVDKGNDQSNPFTVRFPNGSGHQRPSNGPSRMENYKSPFHLKSVDTLYQDSQLSPKYTFDTFIEGDCNRLARSAGFAVAKKPGITSFNPLMVYGGVGLGKTHLAHAIGNEIKKSLPEKFILYVSSEKFINQFIRAVQNNEVQDFTNYYLQVDILIIDDVQFFAGKQKKRQRNISAFCRKGRRRSVSKIATTRVWCGGCRCCR